MKRIVLSLVSLALALLATVALAGEPPKTSPRTLPRKRRRKAAWRSRQARAGPGPGSRGRPAVALRLELDRVLKDLNSDDITSAARPCRNCSRSRPSTRSPWARS